MRRIRTAVVTLSRSSRASSPSFGNNTTAPHSTQQQEARPGRGRSHPAQGVLAARRDDHFSTHLQPVPRRGQDTTVSKSRVAYTVRAILLAIVPLRHEAKHARLRWIECNAVWGFDMTGKTDATGKLQMIFGAIARGTRRLVSLRTITNKSFWILPGDRSPWQTALFALTMEASSPRSCSAPICAAWEFAINASTSAAHG